MITILNMNEGRHILGEYIGRPSPLGNPFHIGEDGTRDEVIEKYRDWLELVMQSWLSEQAAELYRLANIYIVTGRLNLKCWCAPQACHGDIIRKRILDMTKGHVAV